MKKFHLTISLILLLSPVLAQGVNFNYFKLCVFNEKGEILLVNYQDMWEPAGKKYDSTESMQVVIRTMAEEMGVSIKDLKLRALITKYFDKAKHPIVFHYISAQYESGTPAIPPGCKDIGWYPPNKALKIIPFEGLKLVLSKIIEDEKTLWAGALKITTDSSSNKKSVSIKEAFYKY